MHHVAIHRRFNAGKRQIDFCRVQAGLVFGDLRMNGAYLRLLHCQLCGGLIQILTRDGLQFGQSLIALQRNRRQLSFRLRLL
ncbi:hypothetical protein D3C72_2408440 [compost metagenome]